MSWEAIGYDYIGPADVFKSQTHQPVGDTINGIADYVYLDRPATDCRSP